jgi:SMC interacting uncharacterized protein involved in chromosome segregation
MTQYVNHRHSDEMRELREENARLRSDIDAMKRMYREWLADLDALKHKCERQDREIKLLRQIVDSEQEQV